MDQYTFEIRPGQPGYVYATRVHDNVLFEVSLQYSSVEPMRDDQPRMTDPTERAALVAACRAYKAPAAQIQTPRDRSRDIPDVSAEMRRAGFEVEEPAVVRAERLRAGRVTETT